MMRRALFILSLSVMVSLAFAPSARAESVFNLNLLGDRVFSGDVRASALGGGAVLIEDTLGVLQRNTAMLADIRRVTFGVSQYLATNTGEGGNYQRREVAMKFTTFAFAFPVFDRAVLGVGYHANSDAGASFLTPESAVQGADYGTRYERSGGLSSIPIFVAANVTPYAKVGANFAFETGSTKGRWEIIFNDAQDSFSELSRTYTGNSFGLSAVVRPAQQLLLGASFRSEIDYDTDVIETHTNDQANGRYTESTKVPPRWTASATWTPTSKVALYFGGAYSDYTQFEGLAFPSDRLTEEMSGSVGFEYGGPRAGIPLRMSVSYERLPYTLPVDENVVRISGALGTGLRLGKGRGKIDFTLSVGRTGATSTNGFEDRFVYFYVGLVGSEIWKLKREATF